MITYKNCVSQWLANCLVLSWLLNAQIAQVWAHSFHTSTAEMQFNADTGRFEVALRVPLADLQQAAEQMARSQRFDGQAAALVHSHETEVQVTLDDRLARLAQLYIDQHFRLQASRSETTTALSFPQEASSEILKTKGRTDIQWIGMEVDRTSAWLYFELSPPSHNGRLSLVNKVFLDLNKGQCNTVVLISSSGRVALKTDAAVPEQDLPPWSELVGGLR